MSIINITNTSTRRLNVVILEPTEEQIRNATIDEKPCIQANLIRFRKNEYGFAVTTDTLTQKALIAFLAKHHAQHNVLFQPDDSIIVEYTEAARPIWTGHVVLITKQPHRLTIPPTIVWDLEWGYGYPLREYLDSLVSATVEQFV